MVEHKQNESHKNKILNTGRKYNRRAQCTELWGFNFTVHQVLWVICQ